MNFQKFGPSRLYEDSLDKLLDIDETILKNFKMNKKNKSWLSLKKNSSPAMKKPPETETFDIDFSDSELEFTAPDVKEPKKKDVSKKRECSSDSSQNIKKKLKVVDLLQDSFECFDDTQTLMINSKKVKSAAADTNKEVKKLTGDKTSQKSVLLNFDDLFLANSQVNIRHEFEDDPFSTVLVPSDKKDEINKKPVLQAIDTNKNDAVPSTSYQIDDEEFFASFKVTQPAVKVDTKLTEFEFSQENTFEKFFADPVAVEDFKKATMENANYTPISESHVSSSMEPEMSLSDNAGFSQFCNTQVFKKIDDVITNSNAIPSTSRKVVAKTNSFTVTSTQISDLEQEKTKATSTPLKKPIAKNISEFWDDTLNEALGESFKSIQYKKQVDNIFDEIETTICDFGNNPETSNLLNNTNSKEQFSQLLEKTLRNPEMIKKVLESAEKSIRTANGQSEWNDDTLLANAVINMSSDQNIAELIRKAMVDNMRKSVSPQKLCNTTINEDLCQFKSFGPFYGLPDQVKNLIKLYKGIDKLYDWQDECLNLPSINSRKNLVYALPTSGGKTLVAEILILREVLCRKKNAIFILPYVAIVQEKVWSLSPFAVSLEFLIEEYAAGKGTYPPRKRRRKNSVYIATIEKALGLLNSLIDTGRTDEIGLVVVDELHLIGDKSRGPTLEALLAKIIYLKEKIQIIGMSATIGNLSEICTFLHADVYTKNFRPVELVEYVKCGNEIAKVAYNAASEDDLLIFERAVNYKYSEALLKIDPDQLGGLVMEVIPKDSCLIFCRSKQNCENVAILLSKVVFSGLRKHKIAEKENIKQALKEEAGSLCNILDISITFGIAYHHSGLTSEERRLIEEGFRQGIISVICCTSTLAAGVNLPAKRVIIRNPYIGMEFINLSRYKQMVGRAGRAGLGELGESILISTPAELPKVTTLFMSPMDIALSNMHQTDGRGLRQFLLSCISLGIATTKTELQAISNVTLMGVQKEKLEIDVKSLTRGAIKELFKMGALQIEGDKNTENCNNADVTVKLDTTITGTTEATTSTPKQKTLVTVTNESKLIISKMGTAAIKGGLELARAHILFEDLLDAQSSLVLFTGLHLMYLVTPYDIAEQIKPSKALYYNLYSQLNSREIQTAKVLGFSEAVAGKMLTNKKITEISERVLNRFYVTLMLFDLWNEMPVYEVAQKYDINRGLIQNLMTTAATFASNVYHFCEVFEEFWAFSLLLKGMSDRLSHCCVRELMPLMNLPNVKQSRAKQLYQAGYKSLQSIAKADANDLVQNIEYMSRKLANQLIAASKLILLERVENLREEAEDVLDGIQI